MVRFSNKFLTHTNQSCNLHSLLSLAVLCTLRSLCSPVLNFDPSLPVLVWRGVAKVVCRARGVVVSGDECTIRPIISDLCVAMETKAVACVKSALQRNEVKYTVCTYICECEKHFAIFTAYYEKTYSVPFT